MPKNKKFIIALLSVLLLGSFLFGGYVGKSRGIPFIKVASQYSIGIYAGDTPFSLKPAPETKNPVLTASDVTDAVASFVADPFMIKHENKWHMFFEIMNVETDQGDIGLATSDDLREWKYERIVLDEPFHLSYPYVFKHDNEYYMIPESRLAYSIRLYKATDFPTKWIYVKDLVAGNFLDPSIFQYNQRWWMFASERDDILRLFSSDTLDGDWEQHPASPVKFLQPDIARPAGRVLIYQDRIFRFTQDCKGAYGQKVRAFEITELTTETYKEKEIPESTILAASGTGWNAEKMHHIDPHKIADNQWVACVDGFGKSITFSLKH